MKKVTISMLFCIFSIFAYAQVDIGGTANYSQVEDDGTLVFKGTATVWDDIQIPGLAAKAKDKAPVMDIFLGETQLYHFSQAITNSEEQVYFTIQFPHSWAGTTIYPHVHYTPETNPAADESARWGLEYTWVEYNDVTPIVFPSTETVYVDAEVSSSSAKKHLIASFGPIIPSSDQNNISSMMVCRLFRNSGHANDTYTGRVALLQFDIHYEKNTVGSRTDFTK
ncbi:MAG: hypothetical protein C0595_14280 [Marinilabiliales bacterium]|nr:MAG: hypothetical protein C0595_14280 [Marinilabiliales bacterium]